MPTDKKRKIRNTIAITMALVMMLLGIAALDDSNVNPSYGADENLVDSPNYVDRQIIVVFNENVDRASAADIALPDEAPDCCEDGALFRKRFTLPSVNSL